MGVLQSLETNLNDLLVKKAPPLPTNAKKALVQYLPWLNLAFGIISLYTVYLIWHWAHITNNLVDYANTLSAAYGGPQVVDERLTFGVWLGMIVLFVEALLYLAAFPATRDRKKLGWELMFYAMLVNAAYGIVVFFTAYGNFLNLLGSLVGSAVGLYLLFQIRDRYLHASTMRKPVATKRA